MLILFYTGLSLIKAAKDAPREKGIKGMLKYLISPVPDFDHSVVMSESEEELEEQLENGEPRLL